MEYKITVTETVTYQTVVSIQDTGNDIEQSVTDEFYLQGHYNDKNIIDSETLDIDIEPMPSNINN